MNTARVRTIPCEFAYVPQAKEALFLTQTDTSQPNFKQLLFFFSPRSHGGERVQVYFRCNAKR